MFSVGYLFLISSGLFVLLAFITTREEANRKRFFLTKSRDTLDRLIVQGVAVGKAKLSYVLRHIIKLSWYYSLHSMLRAVMGLLVHTYDSLEMIVIKNRERARRLRAEGRILTGGNHLTEIEKHKASTALTSSQKKKLRAKKLERE